ncbi:MAG: undecaprenyl-diphosphate phosphatase [Planctomycetales bacterium]|nr:undecaprenyl-diphosphate phosphatase [Planctomycetales bacterium]
MGLVEILILAVVQGLTEFLPVSSSGHLVVAEAVLQALGRGDTLPDLELVEVNIVLHLGTLLAVIVFYWQRVWRLLGEDRRVAGLLIVGTLPAVVVGLPLKKLFPAVLTNPLLAGAMFFVTAAMLIWASRRPPGDGEYMQLTWSKSLLIGAWQAFAILPGVSRSGSTIVAGLSCGLSRTHAATFAFLLAIPAIGGAGVLELLDMFDAEPSGTPWTYLVAGAAASFLVGLGSLWLLIRIVEHGRLALFALWLIPLGIAVTSWQLGFFSI